MKIYAISGLGADERVFQYLNLDAEIISLKWIPSIKQESIVEYTKRFIEYYNLSNDNNFGILGVSFGGLIAIEISKLLQPKFTIIISSVATKNELRFTIKLLSKLKLVNIIPSNFFKIPKPIAYYMFGTTNKKLLSNIIDDTDLNFAKWAIIKLINWNNETAIPNLIKISGSNDKLLPSTGNNTIVVKNGTHFMIVDKAEEISKTINNLLVIYIYLNNLS